MAIILDKNGQNGGNGRGIAWFIALSSLMRVIRDILAKKTAKTTPYKMVKTVDYMGDNCKCG